MFSADDIAIALWVLGLLALSVHCDILVRRHRR